MRYFLQMSKNIYYSQQKVDFLSETEAKWRQKPLERLELPFMDVSTTDNRSGSILFKRPLNLDNIKNSLKCSTNDSMYCILWMTKVWCTSFQSCPLSSSRNVLRDHSVVSCKFQFWLRLLLSLAKNRNCRKIPKLTQNPKKK